MNIKESVKEREDIIKRLFLTILFLAVFEIIKLSIYLTVFCQFVYALTTKKDNKALIRFANKLTTYAYKTLRYTTLNENEMPFPFKDFPEEMELENSNVEF